MNPLRRKLIIFLIAALGLIAWFAVSRQTDSSGSATSPTAEKTGTTTIARNIGAGGSNFLSSRNNGGMAPYQVMYREGTAVGSQSGTTQAVGVTTLTTPSTFLRPRQVPPKEPLTQPPGQIHRLVVKFADAFQARTEGYGNLSVISSTRLETLANIVSTHRLAFERLQTTTDEQIVGLRERAERLSGTEQPDLLGMLAATPKEATREAVWEAAQALHALPQVEYVSIESLDDPPPPPATDIAPTSELLTVYQGYRFSSGIHVDYAWSQFGSKGAGVKVTDCEYYFNVNHEDLSGLVTEQPGVNSYYTGFGADHGTAVCGVLASGENEYGMTGTNPQATVRFFPEFSTVNGSFQSRTATITAAIASSAQGDVVLLEMQTSGPAGGSAYGPAEYNQAVWTAVKTGSDAGIIVVGAAGNGALNTDDSSFAPYRARGDSGAILVGAASTSRARLSYSTYGARINLQGWGESVASTGYGSFRQYGGDDNQGYTNSFSGTSSASPIVTSAVVLAQSVARARLSRPLTSVEMRQLLIDTGKAQTGNFSQPIGPLPDLSSALPLLMSRFKPPMTSVETFGRYFFNTPSMPLFDDANHNGASNLMEYFLGTNPTVETVVDRARFPRFGPATENGVNGMTLQFNRNLATTDVSWRAEVADTLNAPVWQPLIPGMGGVTIAETADRVSVFVPYQSERHQMFARVVITK